MKKSPKSSPEVCELGVRMVLEHVGEHPSQWAAIELIANKIGCVPQTLHTWVKQHEVDAGQRDGVSTAEAQRIKDLERENRELRKAISDPKAPCPLDRVNRQFRAERPNQLWVSDFTYVSTWQGSVYVAFVIDVFSRRIVGWGQSSSKNTEFVLDALEQALNDRKPSEDGGLVHHSDRGSQYLSIHYSERLAEAGIEPSVGS